MGIGTIFNFTDKQAATYYEVINCIVLINLKPDVVSIDKNRIFCQHLCNTLWGK